MSPQNAATSQDAADQVVDQLLAQPARLREMLTGLVHQAAYLAAKKDWEIEDNFNATEWLNEEIGSEIPAELMLAIVGDSGFELPPEEVEPHLHRYIIDLDEDEDEDEEQA